MKQLRRLLFNYRKFMGWYVVIKLPGNINTDDNTVKLKNHFTETLLGWPIIFTDNNEKIEITWP